MKIAQVSYYDIDGGAARAAYRIHRALRRLGVDSQMFVSSARSGDWTVQTPTAHWTDRINKVRPSLGALLVKSLHSKNKTLHSPALFNSGWPKRLSNLHADVVHLHWIALEMMSIADVGRLQGPVAWTLHDMWGFCGAEHFTEELRWRDGYTQQNRPKYESGLDLNRWTWHRKLKNWRRPMHIVAPSRWLADCVRHSALMKDWPLTVIPSSIDTNIWRPIDKNLARSILGLPADRNLLLFGAIGGTRDPRKGFDLLTRALHRLRGELVGLELVLLGQLAPKEPLDLGFPVHYAGQLHDDISLRLFNSAADVVAVPSRLDNLPNAAIEALACGTPVVAFNACGLPDLVEHKKTGYLARAYDSEDLAQGIRWVLDGTERHAMLRVQSRQFAVERYSYPVVAEQYLNLYQSICGQR